jgi:hypothetical protein
MTEYVSSRSLDPCADCWFWFAVISNILSSDVVLAQGLNHVTFNLEAKPHTVL